MSTVEAPPGGASLAVQALEQEQLGSWGEAARLYALSFRASVLSGDVEAAADALRGQARVRIQEERFEEAEELAGLSREIAERAGLVRSAARAINVMGMTRFRQRDWPGARAHYERALELAIDVGDDDLAGLASQNVGVIAYYVGDLREARAKYLESIGSFVRSGNSGNALLAYNNLGLACASLREWLEAEVYFSRGIEIAERLAQSPLLAKLYGNRAEPLIHIGETEEALGSLEKAERAAAAVGDRLALADASRWRGVIAAGAGRPDEAEAHLLRSLELAAEPSMERAETLRELGALREAQARPAEARDAYTGAADIFRQLGAEVYARQMEARAAGA